MSEPPDNAKKVPIVSSIPRRDGNSRLLADAALESLREAGCAAAPGGIAR